MYYRVQVEGQARTEKDKERTRRYRERGVRKKGKKCEHKDEYLWNPASYWIKNRKVLHICRT